MAHKKRPFDQRQRHRLRLPIPAANMIEIGISQHPLAMGNLKL